VRIRLLGVAALLALASTPAKAALLNEGYYTLDSVTGLDWYHPSLTVGMNATEALAVAGVGYNPATIDQFSSLMSYYVGPTTGPAQNYGGFYTAESSSYLSSALDVIDKLGGQTWSFNSADLQQESLLGFLDQTSPPGAGYYAIAELTAVTANTGLTPYGRWGAAFWQTETAVIPVYGVYLVREDLDFQVASVPEPSTWAMMLVGFAGVGFMAYRRKNGTLRVAA
jgi:hypothetical protein